MKQQMILKFWKTVLETHGPIPIELAKNFQPSREDSQRFLLNIPQRWFSEDEITAHIGADRKGALSLFLATIWQACLDEWAVKDKDTLAAAAMPDIKMDGEQFERVDATGFCFSAIQNYPFFRR
jgi:hypothetical protein